MKLGDIDWDIVPKGHAYLVQNNESGDIYNCDDRFMDVKKDKLTILAKRPKPQLTAEQIEAVREFCKWSYYYKDTADVRIEEWLKQRGGEHE